MRIVIQPVLNLDELEQPQTVSRERLVSYEEQEVSFIKLLELKLPQIEVQEISRHLPRDVKLDEFILWFVGSYPDERIIELALSLDEKIKNQTILFCYAGDDPRGLLEATHFAGLVTEATAHYWKADFPKTAFKLGVGHGLYGLKSMFDKEKFIPLFKSLKSSEHYMIFYNYTDYQLDRILFEYLTALSEARRDN